MTGFFPHLELVWRPLSDVRKRGRSLCGWMWVCVVCDWLKYPWDSWPIGFFNRTHNGWSASAPRKRLALCRCTQTGQICNPAFPYFQLWLCFIFVVFFFFALLHYWCFVLVKTMATLIGQKRYLASFTFSRTSTDELNIHINYSRLFYCSVLSPDPGFYKSRDLSNLVI